VALPSPKGSAVAEFSLKMYSGLATTREYEGRILSLFVVVERTKSNRTKSNRTQVRLNFNPFIAINLPWFSKDIPTVLVSLANPYHLIDAPYVSTFIHGYSDNTYAIDSIVEKMMGKSTFKGINLVDPYCGNRWDVHLYD